MKYVNVNVVIRVRKLSKTGLFRVIILEKLTLSFLTLISKLGPGYSKDGQVSPRIKPNLN